MTQGTHDLYWAYASHWYVTSGWIDDIIVTSSMVGASEQRYDNIAGNTTPGTSWLDQSRMVSGDAAINSITVNGLNVNR